MASTGGKEYGWQVPDRTRTDCVSRGLVIAGGERERVLCPFVATGSIDYQETLHACLVPDHPRLKPDLATTAYPSG